MNKKKGKFKCKQINQKCINKELYIYIAIYLYFSVCVFGDVSSYSFRKPCQPPKACKHSWCPGPTALGDLGLGRALESRFRVDRGCFFATWGAVVVSYHAQLTGVDVQVGSRQEDFS